MGVRMSGEPSCASTEPSMYSTRECTTLCGWITTSMRSTGSPNSSCASISSRPLFIRVAESTEILRPMFHVGCAQACSGVAFCSAEADQLLNGPPEAVSITRRTPGGSVPSTVADGRHWKTALCSLSMGMMVAPDCLAAASTWRPAITRASLLAISRRLPAPAAASVEFRPAAPTMAAIT